MRRSDIFILKNTRFADYGVKGYDRLVILKTLTDIILDNQVRPCNNQTCRIMLAAIRSVNVGHKEEMRGLH